MITDQPQLSDLAWLNRLARQHNAQLPDLELADAYYEGEQPLSYMHPELLRRLDGRVRQVVVNWPELVVDSLDERLDLTGFRLGGEDAADRELWQVWRANRMGLNAQQAHIDALVMGRSFAIVGTNENDANTPLVTVESPLETHVELDPRTRRVRAALKRTTDDEADGQSPTYATLYLPNTTVWYASDTGVTGTWQETNRDEHGMGVVPVVPLVNRPRTTRRRYKVPGLGRSELASVLPLSDAVCKLATDLMISAEFHAMPRRYALGFDKEDFVDAQGKPLTPWEAVAGVLWASPKNPKDDGVSVGQFPEAELNNFLNAINGFARLVASITGLPPHYLGHGTENPASADAIRSSEARHIKRAERRQGMFGDAWEQVMRLVLLVRDGRIPAEALRLESMWTDAATPTFAARADAVSKLYGTDKLLPRRASRRALGYSDGQIRDMEAEDQEAYGRIVGGDQAAEFGPKPDADPDPPAAVDAEGVPRLPSPRRGNAAVQFREPALAGR